MCRSQLFWDLRDFRCWRRSAPLLFSGSAPDPSAILMRHCNFQNLVLFDPIVLWNTTKFSHHGLL